MKLATLAAILGVAALLFFAFGCTASAPPAPGGTPLPTPPSDIPPPPPDSGASTPPASQPPSPPTGGDAPPPAPV